MINPAEFEHEGTSGRESFSHSSGNDSDSPEIVGQAIVHAITGQEPPDIRFAPQENGSYLFVNDTQTEEGLNASDSSKNAALEVLRGVGADIKNDDQKLLALSLVGATALSQFVDRSRLVLIFGPQVALEVAERTNNSIAGGMAVAGMFAVSNFVVGETLTQTMDRFPAAKNTFKTQFPKTIRVFKDSLAGVESRELTDEIEATEDIERSMSVSKLQKIRAKLGLVSLELSQAVQDRLNPFETPEQKLRREFYARERYNELQDITGSDEEDFSLRFKRAGTGIGLGSTAFVATSSVEGHEKKTVRSINYKVTRDTAILITAIGTGVIESIKRMYQQGWHEAAQKVDNVVSDSKTWLGVAALSIISTFISNRRAYKKLEHEEAEDLQLKTVTQQ